VTPLQYQMMKDWANGNFTNDWPPPSSQPAVTPEGLTRAMLETCVGAPFYPGIEASTKIQDTFPYVEPFRFDISQMSPGDVTQQMAVPWQADFTDCSGGDSANVPAWWPAQRPDTVYTSESATPNDWVKWNRDIDGGSGVNTMDKMVKNWFRFGFVVDPGDGNLIETERT